jgi:hypothetical protein
MVFFGKVIGMQWVPDNLRAWLQELESLEGKKVYVDIGKEKGVRTPDQNAALHLYLEHLAKALNDGGFPFKFILGTKTVELDWDKDLVKENVWRPIQKALTGKKSTTSLDKVTEIDKVYEHLNRFFSNKPFCLHVPFPSDATKPKVEVASVDYPINNLGESKF